MSVLRSVFIKLGLDVDSASFAEGAAAEKLLEKGLETLVELGKEFVEGIAEQIAGVVEYGDQLNKAAQRTGIARDALQELYYVANLADVSNEEFGHSLILLSKNMQKAKEGSEEVSKAFKGIKVTDATGKLRSADEVMGDIAEKFSKMPDGAEKTALAMEYFGRAGAQMIPILNKGAAGLDELRQEARDLGLVIDDEAVKASEELTDNFKRLHMVTVGLWRQAIGPLITFANKVVERFLAWRKENAKLMQQRIHVFVGYATKALQFLDGALKFVIDNMGTITTMTKIAAAAFVILRGAAVASAEATVIAWAVAAAPFVAIGAAIAALLLVFDDLRVYRSGKGRSLFGLWANQIAEWQKPNANDPWWLKAVKDLVVYLEKALGLYNKMSRIFGPEQEPGKPASTASRVASGAATVGKGALGAAVGGWLRFPQFGFAKRFDERADAAGAQGVGFLGRLEAGFGFGGQSSTPSLPAGGGVLRAPQTNYFQRNYTINPPSGVTPQDIADAIQAHEDAANEEAAAALSE